MKWNRDKYIELMTFGNPHRQMFVELFGLLVGLDEEWKNQGASKDELELKAFDFDYMQIVGCGGNTDVMSNITPQVLEDNDEYIIQIDSYGRKTKLCKSSATIPLPIDYPVKDMNSWLKIKHWFKFSEDRINWKTVEEAGEAQKNGALVVASIPGGFDLPRQLMGEEGVCFCYYDQPELMHDILDTAGNTAYQVLDRISDRLLIDNLMVHEDMAGKPGPLIGPNLVLEFVKPYYRKIWDLLSSKGTKLFSQDSDGNLNAVVDAFLESGINIMLPAEPAAGNWRLRRNPPPGSSVFPGCLE